TARRRRASRRRSSERSPRRPRSTATEPDRRRRSCQAGGGAVVVRMWDDEEVGVAETAGRQELARLEPRSGDVVLRRATRGDVPAIVALLVDDPLGRDREGADDDGLAPYLAAFDAVDADPAQLLVVATA